MRQWVKLFDRSLDYSQLTPDQVSDVFSYPIVRYQKMDHTRLFHALERLEQTNIDDSEKIRLLVSIVNDLISRVSILEADVDILAEGINENSKR
jgi:hypothetical protein